MMLESVRRIIGFEVTYAVSWYDECGNRWESHLTLDGKLSEALGLSRNVFGHKRPCTQGEYEAITGLLPTIRNFATRRF